MDSINFQMVDNTLDSIDGYHSDESDYSVVGRGSPPNSPQHDNNASQGRTDIAKINEFLRKLDEEFDKRDEDELSRKDQLELLKARETIDLEINDGIESLSTILKNEDLNDLLKEIAQAAKEKIIGATETASSGETTLKRPIELLTEIIPVFCTVSNKSCEQFKSDDTAKAEFVKYEAAIEKIKACEDVEERNECIKVANEILGKCIELAKQNVDRITEKRNMEEIEGRSASFEETKVKVDNIVQAELNDTKRWVNNCEHDGTILSQWLKEVEEEHTAATKSFEKTKKSIKYKISENKREQEDLKKKLKACEVKERLLKVALQEEELQQDEAKESYSKFCGKVLSREKNVSGIEKRAKTASKVMTYMEACSRMIMEQSIQAEQEYCERLRSLEVSSKESYHQALLTSAVDIKIEVKNITEYLEDCQKESKLWASKKAAAVKKGMTIPAKEAKDKLEMYNDEIKKKEDEKKSKEEKIQCLIKDIDEIADDLKTMHIEVETLESMYAIRVQQNEDLSL